MEENKIETAQKIVSKMMANDEFSHWLGIRVVEILPGKVTLSMDVRREFTNGFKVAHGGICYSLADSALAFSANGHGRHSLSIETSISHTRPVYEGDILTTEVTEISGSRTLGLYHVMIYNQKSELVAAFKGTVYRKETSWEL